MKRVFKKSSFSGIIILMSILSYNELLSRYFFISFLPRNMNKDKISYFEKNENKVFTILKKYVSSDCKSFDLTAFVSNENEFFGLLPDEIKSVGKAVLSSMIKDFNERCSNLVCGFIQICLEKLFDNRFREEFNKKTNDFLKLEENRCRKNGKLKEFYDVDILRDFLRLCSEDYYFNFSNDIPEWNFSFFPDNKEIGHRKSGDKTEKVNNLFIGYKLYGQGEYSKLLIAYMEFPKNSLIELRKLGVKEIIVSDNEIQKALKLEIIAKNEKELINRNNKEISNNFLADNSVEKIIAINKLLHSRFSRDYVPYELDGKYNSAYPNKTLREEIIDLCKYNDSKKEEDVDLPWNSDQCQTIKALFVKQLEKYGLEKCKAITENQLFYDYEYEELNSKEALRKQKIPIKTLYDVLKKFDDKNLLRDGRSEGNGLQSFAEIKNAYLLHQMVDRDTPVSENDENETTIFEIKDDKKYTNCEKEIRSDIENESGGVCGFLIQRMKEEFKNNYSLMCTLKKCCEKFNTEPEQILYQSVDNKVINRFEIVKNVIKKIDKSYLIKFEDFFDKENLESIKLSMYEESSSMGWKTYSLQNILNLKNNKLIEKIWFCILFEDLRGSDKNPWREFGSARYLNGAFNDEEKKHVEKMNKQSMKRIYESLLNY